VLQLRQQLVDLQRELAAARRERESR